MKPVATLSCFLTALASVGLTPGRAQEGASRSVCGGQPGRRGASMRKTVAKVCSTVEKSPHHP